MFAFFLSCLSLFSHQGTLKPAAQERRVVTHQCNENYQLGGFSKFWLFICLFVCFFDSWTALLFVDLLVSQTTPNDTTIYRLQLLEFYFINSIQLAIFPYVVVVLDISDICYACFST